MSHIPNVIRTIIKKMSSEQREQHSDHCKKVPVGLEWPSESESEELVVKVEKLESEVGEKKEIEDPEILDAYDRFVEEEREKIKSKFPSFSDEEINKASISCWKDMDPRDKIKYIETLQKFSHRGLEKKREDIGESEEQQEKQEVEEGEDEEEEEDEAWGKLQLKSERVQRKRAEKDAEPRRTPLIMSLPINLLRQSSFMEDISFNEMSNASNSIRTASTQANEDSIPSEFPLNFEESIEEQTKVSHREFVEQLGENSASNPTESSSLTTSSSLGTSSSLPTSSSEPTESQSENTTVTVRLGSNRLSIVEEHPDESESSNHHDAIGDE